MSEERQPRLWIGFNNDAFGYAVQNARQLRERLGESGSFSFQIGDERAPIERRPELIEG